MCNYWYHQGDTNMTMNSYVADELSNKIYHMNLALNKAQTLISILETENEMLKKIVKILEDEKIESVSA